MNNVYGYQQNPYQNNFQQYRPNIQIMTQGYGIDQNEFNTITTCCANAYLYKQLPFSTNAASNIKRAIGGEWFVCASPVGAKDFDFSLTSARTDDQLIFSVDTVLFQVCRLK